MALPSNRPAEVRCDSNTASIATTPVNAYAVVSTAGYVERVMAAAGGTTTGTVTVTVKINNGSDIAGGNLTIAAGSNPRAGTVVELSTVGTASTSAVFVNEGDIVEFAPSGGTGSSIGGAFALVIRPLN